MAHDILIIDDEADIRVLVAGILEDEGFQPREAGDSDSALASVETRRPSLVLLDIWLQGSELDGLGILQVIKKDHPTVPVLMMSGHGTVETAVKAIKLGAYDFIEKPFKADRLILMIERAIESARLKREIEELRLRAGSETDLIGNSPAINQVRQAIDRVAPANSRVLISGPAGSGKEVVARLLHARSRRSDGPFVVVNCATMEPGRVEIELFGAESPPGDEHHKVGMLEQAHNGTLFLDEVSDMPLETQGKVVRALQEQIFERVGGTTRVEVDVRVVAGATRDLAAEISEGNFREDLYYRLNVVPIEVPPLRDRREDIPLLADFFLERMGEVTGRAHRRIGPEATVALQAYDWPGNVRELRNIIERMLIMTVDGDDEPIGVNMLPAEICSPSSTSQDWEGSSKIMTLPLREAREIFEREYLNGQVTRFDGNISRTAAFVGMERSALHRKLKSLGVLKEAIMRGSES
jgi:two-component system nitrogen regulation response regulator NtrX